MNYSNFIRFFIMSFGNTKKKDGSIEIIEKFSLVNMKTRFLKGVL